MLIYGKLKEYEIPKYISLECENQVKIKQQIKGKVIVISPKKDNKGKVAATTSYKKDNNESIGMTCEYLLCKVNGIENNIEHRISTRQIDQLEYLIKSIPLPLKKWIGGENKSIDFICQDDSTLSVKSTLSKNNKVCPQKIGQPTRKKFIETFGQFGNIMDTNESIKAFIYNNLEILIPLYFNNLFCCDKTLWIWQTKPNVFDYIIINKLKYKFNFTDLRLSHNNEKWDGINSNQLFYKDVKIGEFQLHNNRSCVKYRFYINNLLLLIKNEI